MSEGRLPAHLEVSDLIRAVEVQGGFATVLAKGDRDAGVVLLLTIERGKPARLWERMPNLDGSRAYHNVRQQKSENDTEFFEYLDRLTRQDADAWLVELDIPEAERFIADFAR